MGRLRAAWRALFKPRPMRIPGVYPWNKPKPMPFGTVLIDGGAFKVIADGKGGVTTTPRVRRATQPQRR